MSDLIDRQSVLNILSYFDLEKPTWQLEMIKKLPSAEPEIIYCKDCAKNGKELKTIPRALLKEEACPLINWRGKAQGHEFDYQFCAYAKRRTSEVLSKMAKQGCMDFKQREEANDDEDITVKSIATAFQFGVALGFAKKYDEMDKVIEEVKKAITPEPKTGKWEWVQYDSNHEIGDWHCSECGFIPASFNLAKKHLNYCPNCGARMVGEEG